MANGAIDTCLKDVSPEVRNALTKLKVNGISVHPKKVIHGNSWEMAAIMAGLGRTGVYSGTCASVLEHTITFGPVPGVHIKKKLDANLQTCKEIPVKRTLKRGLKVLEIAELEAKDV
jgi:hypothetical protein